MKTTRICKSCAVEKPLTDYYKRGDGKGIRWKCKSCELAILRERHRIAPRSRRPYVRPEHLRDTRLCVVCGREFTPHSGRHKYCSTVCKGRAKYLDGTVTTASQYRTISGNWWKYFQRLSNGKGRRQAGCTTEVLMDVWARQEGRCALSGEELTCVLEDGRGRVPTNASVDRILHGQPYTPDNIRLVCSIVNTMRFTQTDAELRKWCLRILENEP